MLSRGDLVKALAEGLTTDFFLSMLNPSSRGARFQFSTFDIERWVQRGLGINLPSPPTPEELTHAGAIARARWARMIEQVGDGIPVEVR